jgi:CRISPR-associated protein (TIGR03986 family)
MNPKHISEVPESIKDDKGNDIPRRAVAPYNFVELPEKVVEAQPLPDGDRYYPVNYVEILRQTGRIECTLTTESPLYTRCGWSPEDFAKYGEVAFKDLPDEIKKLRANFFINPATHQLMIPGSSIRGMLRTLVEIVSFSKIERVTDKKLFYRSLGDPALKCIYQANFVDNLGDVQHSPNPKAPCYRSKVHAGFLRKRDNSYFIEECGYGRIDRNANNRVIPTLPNQRNIPTKPLYQGSSPAKTPSWTYQHQTIYVDIDPSEQDHFFIRQTNRNGKQRHPNLYLRFRKVHSASFTPAPDLQKCTLVITGDMQHKHLEFVFLDKKLKEYPVEEQIIRRFQDDDQITKWQEKAYPKDKPSRGSREKDGYLRDGEPVFFLLNNDDTVRFFGRAQMFRLPYNNSPLDFVPEKLRDKSKTDIAEAIFGYVDGKKPRKEAYASRVFITDATLQRNQDKKVKSSLNKDPQEILLSSPKPTTFQHYLVQTSEKKSELKHYASQPPGDTESGETIIRGHKLYWHKPAQIEVPRDASDTQTSRIKPIDSGIEFTFTLYFENLSDVELGALLWVLDIAQNDKYRLSLGMGKPLGLGGVKIEPTLYLSSRQKRYQNLFDSNDCWEKGETESNTDISNYISKFETYMLEKLNHTGDFKNLCRIQMLLAMLSWPGITDVENNTRYMEITREREPRIGNDPNEYKQRPILPDPLDVMREVTRIKIECDRPSPSNPKKSAKQPIQQFSEGQKIDAKVVNIQVQEGQKLKTIITYEIQGSDSSAKEETYKPVSLAVGDILKVSIVKAQGKSIRKVKRV